MKKIIVTSVATLLLSSCTLFPKNTDQNVNLSVSPTQNMVPPTSSGSPSPTVTTQKGDTVVALKTTDGQIVIKLFSKETPETVKTFMGKVNSGFYNGLTFHRVIEGFMAQGGDPTGTGTGGGSQKSEINSIPFVRGSLGLARTPVSKDISNDSQFFICFTTEGCQHLTGDYVNFGQVISGLDILDKIQQGDKILEITASTK
ncbi:peptidylprolyl isomerase [Candidatus Shapirobacteria bacterium]|nr:peptidylprolyl isomerase [Candidatus Shapirobacteria bacterium]